MTGWLRQSTATTINMGPFLSATDGDTEEPGLTILQADVLLSKGGGGLAQKNEASSGTYDVGGHYRVNIDATDTNTLGRLRTYVHKAGVLAVWMDFMVVPANVYDGLVAGSDKLDVDAYQVTAGAITATAVATGAIDADAIADNAIDAGAIATGAITAAKFAAGAIDAAAIAPGAIDADALAADAVDEIWDEVLEAAYTARQIMRLLLAAPTGKTTDAGTKFRDVADIKNRIVAVLDGAGNRTSMTLDAT